MKQVMNGSEVWNAFAETLDEIEYRMLEKHVTAFLGIIEAMKKHIVITSNNRNHI